MASGRPFRMRDETPFARVDAAGAPALAAPPGLRVGRLAPSWRAAVLVLAVASLAASALAVHLLLPAWWERLAGLVALYVLTPVGKEALIPLAETAMGVPALAAALLFLLVDVAFCLATMLVVPVERLARVARAAERLRVRVSGSRVARRGLAFGLWAVLMLPVHSGGAVLGTLAGRGLGLGRGATFAAVLGATAARFGLVLLAWWGFLLWA